MDSISNITISWPYESPLGKEQGEQLKGAEKDREKICVNSQLLLGSMVESWYYLVSRKKITEDSGFFLKGI